MTIEATLARILELSEVIAKNTAAKSDVVKTKPAKGTPPTEPVKVVEPEKAEPQTDIFGDDEPAAEVTKPLTKDDLRAVLVKYQTATTQENARKLLAKYNAQTLGAVKEADYANIAAEAVALTASKKAP